MPVKDTIYAKYIKRILDIICAAVALLLFWWLYLAVAIIVRLKLGSPVIYSATRIGMGNKPFRLYKFRSMSDERDENGNLMPDSQRLTKFGRILRSTSLDELPEVWNILKGDMSVIGPRPWNQTDYKYFTEQEKQRHIVRPGLSGWAQVNGRTTSTWDKRIAFDLEYVNKVSFPFDLGVIVKTIVTVLKRSDIVDTAEDQGNFSDYRKQQWVDGTVEKPVWFVELEAGEKE